MGGVARSTVTLEGLSEEAIATPWYTSFMSHLGVQEMW